MNKKEINRKFTTHIAEHLCDFCTDNGSVDKEKVVAEYRDFLSSLSKFDKRIGQAEISGWTPPSNSFTKNYLVSILNRQ